MKKDYISKLISALLIICMVIVTGSLSGCSGENVKDQLVGRWENNFESDDYLNLNKLESSFNFFLINSYYKYLSQISLHQNY